MRHSLAALAVAVLLCASPAGAMPREAALEHGLTSDDAYSYSLLERSKGAEKDKKVALLEKAVENSPDTPGFYFALSKAKLPSLVMSLGEFIEGLKAYGRSFWWVASLVVLLAVSALYSLALTFFAIALIRFPKDMPLLAHDMNERKVLLVLPFLVAPLAYFGPLAFVAGLLFMVSFYTRRMGKTAVYAALLLVALSPVWSDGMGRLLSVTNPVMRAIVDVNEGRDNMLALDVLGKRDDFASRFSYALALKREGRAEEAVALLERLVEENGSARLYTNLGNAYVASGRRDLAKAAYLKAVKQGGTVATFYNLAQIYRDELDYESGDKYFKEAQGMNKELVSEFTGRHGRHFNRLVVDETLVRREIVQEAMMIRGSSQTILFSNGPPAVPAGIAAFLFLLFAVLDGKGVMRSFKCKNCGKEACEGCADNTKMCAECKGQLSDQDDASPQARVRRMLQANRQKERHMAVIRALSFAPPGVPQIFSGRLFSGMFYFWLFSFSITLLVLDPYMSTGLAGGSHVWLWLLLVPFMLLLYYTSFVTVNRRLNRGWL